MTLNFTSKSIHLLSPIVKVTLQEIDIMTRQNKYGYLVEIDVLRALAILGVLIYHLNPHLPLNGFVGVDIFFVISGFLITQHIIAELADNSFSFAAFYSKRIRRIIPAYLTLLLLLTIICPFLLLPADLISFKTSIGLGIAFLANYFPIIGYSPNQFFYEAPLTHTWSLAVEEQFYFFWPFIIIAAHRLRLKIGTIICLLYISAIAYTEYIIQVESQNFAAYHSPFARASELLTGCYLATVKQSSIAINASPNQLKALGLLLIVMSLIYSKNETFPGLSSLLPTLGTAFYIIGIIKNPSSQLIKSQALTTIGKLSYSLYLWHYPVLALQRYFLNTQVLPLANCVAAVIVTFILASLSYFFVERPIRNYKNLSFQASLSLMLYPSFLIILLVGSPYYQGVEFPKNISSFSTDKLCFNQIHSSCRIVESLESILVIGDSHAAHFSEFFKSYYHNKGVSVDLVAAARCIALPDFDTIHTPSYYRQACQEVINYFNANYQKYDTIIFAFHYSRYLNFSKIRQSQADITYFKEQLTNTLADLKKQGKEVLVIEQIPTLKYQPLRSEIISKFGIKLHNEALTEAKKANEEIQRQIRPLGVISLNFASFFKSLKQNSIYEGLSVYMDDNHLNDYGAAALGQWYKKQEH
jgi:peptidoglycan/LPS O-acetylase OafA/YrhL